MKKTSKSRAGKPAQASYSKIAVKAACILGGVVLGSQIKKIVEKKNSVSGTDLFGLDGDMSKYTASGIVTAAGVIGAMFVPNNVVKDIALGTAVAGAAGIINTATGKSIVALGDTDEKTNSPIILPGIGEAEEEYPYLPGIGSEEVLPTNSDSTIEPILQGTEKPSLY